MKKCFSIVLLFLAFQMTYAEGQYLKGKIVSLVKRVAAEEGDSETKEIAVYQVKLLSGEQKGELREIELASYRTEEYNLAVRIGDRVVLYVEEGGEGLPFYQIIDVDKRASIFFLLSLFVALTLLISRKKGLRALYSLGITVLFFFKIFIPAILRGDSPIFYAVLTGFFAILLSIILMTGLRKKGMVAILGSISGVFFAGLLSYFLTHRMRLSGFETAESLSFASQFRHIRMKELIPAGIIIGTMGAVMDVSMSIASSLQELTERKPGLRPRELFSSALNIGNDIIGTMINTLILAYIGSSLLMIVMLSIQKGDYPWIRILNFEEIAVEILRSIAGSIGILISVPLTAYIGAIVYGRKTKALTK